MNGSRFTIQAGPNYEPASQLMDGPIPVHIFLNRNL